MCSLDIIKKKRRKLIKPYLEMIDMWGSVWIFVLKLIPLCPEGDDE